jgi:hypothetical protein
LPVADVGKVARTATRSGAAPSGFETAVNINDARLAADNRGPLALRAVAAADITIVLIIVRFCIVERRLLGLADTALVGLRFRRGLCLLFVPSFDWKDLVSVFVVVFVLVSVVVVCASDVTLPANAIDAAARPPIKKRIIRSPHVAIP